MTLLPPLYEQYKGKKVFITGHTGFKGAWLALILKNLGAEIIGYSLPLQTNMNLFSLTGLVNEITHIEGDIRNYEALNGALLKYQPDMVFHLAAQAIVLDGYHYPKETFDVNSGGTINVLEAIRKCSSVKASVIITTDKCYENNHWLWGYRENDPLGGQDPYSASKSMAEIAVRAYRDSFFSEDAPLIASVRAGNIIGGGDFSSYRILPDCMRALASEQSIGVRNPHSSRPWLYVLDALAGYLQLGSWLLSGDRSKAEAWNFGPQENRAITVKEIVESAIKLWGKGNWQDLSLEPKPKEMPLLRLNWDKAANSLQWQPSFNWQQALKASVQWYKAFYQNEDIRTLSLQQIKNHPSFQDCPHEVYCCAS